MTDAAGLVQAFLFVAGEPVEKETLADWTRMEPEELAECLRVMEAGSACSGLVIRHVGSKVQLVTNPCYAQQLSAVFAPPQAQSLSASLLETLAVVAYRQPVTRAEIEQIRGVRCTYAISSLLERGLVRKIGVKDAVGRPSLYGTTDAFLMHFGLESLDALPPLKESGAGAGAPDSQENQEP